MWRRRVVLVSVVVLAVAGGAPCAAACSCAPSSDEELIAWAGTVFVGRVLGVDEGGGSPSSSANELVWTFEVSEVYKGAVRRTQQVVSVADSCALALVADRTYLVFTDPDPTNPGAARTQLRASLCGGTRSGTDGSLGATIATPSRPLGDEEPLTPAPEPEPVAATPPPHTPRLPLVAAAALACLTLIALGAGAVTWRRR